MNLNLTIDAAINEVRDDATKLWELYLLLAQKVLDCETLIAAVSEATLVVSEQEEANLIVGSEEITFEMPDGRVFVHYFVSDEF